MQFTLLLPLAFLSCSEAAKSEAKPEAARPPSRRNVDWIDHGPMEFWGYGKLPAPSFPEF
jgi:hypothetical protein